jgi:predicted O-methyltransferase YrrM
MLLRLVKRYGRVIAPGLKTRLSREYWHLKKEARCLINKAKTIRNFEYLPDLVIGHPTFQAVQVKEEIVALLRVVNNLKPKHVLEIGGKDGGSLFLFARCATQDAVLCSVDINFTKARMMAHRFFGVSKQRIVCIPGDSHSSRVFEQVVSCFPDGQVDFLFIDGDHSYEGIKRDYQTYTPLVRDGGIIAFHDIVPDYMARYGTPTGCYTGGVPIFWCELKKNTINFTELVHDSAQDGFGIGLIYNHE